MLLDILLIAYYSFQSLFIFCYLFLKFRKSIPLDICAQNQNLLGKK